METAAEQPKKKLTREEELAIWLKEKKRRSEGAQQSKGSSRNSGNSKTKSGGKQSHGSSGKMAPGEQNGREAKGSTQRKQSSLAVPVKLTRTVRLREKSTRFAVRQKPTMKSSATARRQSMHGKEFSNAEAKENNRNGLNGLYITVGNNGPIMMSPLSCSVQPSPAKPTTNARDHQAGNLLFSQSDFKTPIRIVARKQAQKGTEPRSPFNGAPFPWEKQTPKQKAGGKTQRQDQQGPTEFIPLPSPSPKNAKTPIASRKDFTPTDALQNQEDENMTPFKGEPSPNSAFEKVLPNTAAHPNSPRESAGPLLASLSDYEPVKVDGKSVLEPVLEDKQFLDTTPTCACEEVVQLRSRMRRLIEEKATLQGINDRLRKSNEGRAAPFRNLFEEQKKLRSKNASLVKEKAEHAEKMDKMVLTLQNKMASGLQAAIQQIQVLQNQLKDAHGKIKLLEDKCAHVESPRSNDHLIFAAGGQLF